jgi:hypothetical protein
MLLLRAFINHSYDFCDLSGITDFFDSASDLLLITWTKRFFAIPTHALLQRFRCVVARLLALRAHELKFLRGHLDFLIAAAASEHDA